MPLHQHLEKIPGFFGVATHGSFRKAAEMLGISQPSLSQSIAILEETLEVKLFTRSSKGVELTSEGMRLHTFALEVLAMSRQTESKLTQGNAEKEWTLSIGSYESLMVHFWPKLLQHLQRVDQRLQINLITGRSSMIFEELMEGFLDAALCVDPLVNPRIEHQLVYEDSYGIYGRSEIIAGLDQPSNPRVVDRNELLRHVGFVFSTASAGLGQTLEQLLWTLNIRFKKCQFIQSFEATAAMIEAGLGLGILPHRIASSLKSHDVQIVELKLTDCEPDWGRHRIELCYLKDKPLNPRLKSLEFHLSSWIASLDPNSLTIKAALVPNNEV